MRTFPGWRQAAHLMRWARRQDGVTADTAQYDLLVDNRWRRADGIEVRVGHIRGEAATDLRVNGERLDLWLDQTDTAGALRVLAALGLIPAELAEVHDERDERCAWCHRFGHAAEQHPLPKGHPQYDAFYDATDDELAGRVPPRPGATR